MEIEGYFIPFVKLIHDVSFLFFFVNCRKMEEEKKIPSLNTSVTRTG